MTTADTLRDSNDGHQFHYTWAARQSLRLLDVNSSLCALVVEAVDPSERGGRAAGEDVIDLAEYWGSQDIDETTQVVYRQFKHSTAHPDEPWTMSFLTKTLIGFARKYAALAAEHPGTLERARFEFICNRPTAQSAIDALADLRTGATSAAARRVHAQLEGILPLETISEFSQKLTIDTRAPSLLELRTLLDNDLVDRLPGAPGDEALRLREMIATRATSITGSRPEVRRGEVLAALKTSEDLLFPAPNLIARPTTHIERVQFGQIAQSIAGSSGRPIVIHGPGGVGKSVLANALGQAAPSGSLTVTFDCYGNGSYRRPSRQRHQPRQGLVQLVNELAGHALCLPLIPASTASDKDYFAAFVRRVDEAAAILEEATPGALLTIAVDAADNAAMMAEEVDEQPFVRGLVREQFASNVRLVLTCRTERIGLLGLPSSYLGIELDGYTLDETRSTLTAAYSDAGDGDVGEFHRRTSRNPRVQATVLDATETLDQALAWLGPNPASAQDALDSLIARQVAEIRDGLHARASEIDEICVGLAALRPMIPVRVLARLAGVHESVVHSFVADIGRPLLLDHETVQFRDEPTETWFRGRFRPTGDVLNSFLDRLLPLADDDVYVAASVPSLLFEAGRFDGLVALAMSDAALPDAALPADERNAVQRLEIAQQRAQFALRAALKRDDDYSAALLALRVGTLSAGRTRRLRLIRENTDIAPRYIDGHVLEHLIATRSINAEWINSHIVYEGALLATTPGQTEQARNQLRSASSWMSAWTREAASNGTPSGVTDNDISHVAWGLICTDGPEAAVNFLRSWRPKEVAFEAGARLVRRLADAGRFEDIEDFAMRSRGRHLKFAVAQVCAERGLRVGPAALRNLLRPLLSAKKALKPSRREDERWTTTDQFVHGGLTAANWIVLQSLRQQLIDSTTAKQIISYYVPRNLGHYTGGWNDHDIWELIAVLALDARLDGRRVDAEEIEGPRVTEARSKATHVYGQDLRTYDANVKPLAWWADLWVRMQINPTAADIAEFREAAKTFLAERSEARRDDDTERIYLNIAIQLILRAAADHPAAVEVAQLREFWSNNRRRLWRGTRIRLVREAGRNPKFHAFALQVAQRCYDGMVEAREDAQERSDDLVSLARVTYPLSGADAAAYFQSALSITDAIGDDAWDRWGTFLKLAPLAADGTDAPGRAYRLGQIAEGLEPYLGDGLNHVDALQAAATLSLPEALALGSRWRDRRFAPIGRLVAALARSQDLVTADEAIALLPLSDSYLDDHAMAAALSFDRDNALTSLTTLLQHRRAEPLPSEALETLLRRAGVPRDQVQERDPTLVLDQAIERPPEPDRRYRPRGKPEAPPAFGDLDFRTAAGWAEALDRASGSHRELVFDHLVRTDQLVPEVFAAFAANPDVDRFDFDELVSTVGDRPLSVGAKIALDSAYKEALQRVADKYLLVSWRTIDFARLRAQTGQATDYEHVASRALVTLKTFNAEQAYALAAHLARRLSTTKAQELFDAAAGLFLDSVPLDFSDGHHPLGMAQELTRAEALSTTIWAALGDPAIATRWRAAHSVLHVLELNLSDVADNLIELANGHKDASTFVDGRLEFYDRHARQWLLYGLARASVDSRTLEAVAPFAPWLRTVIEGPPHAINGPLARDIILRLHTAGLVACEPDEVEELSAVGRPIDVERAERHSAERRVTSLADLANLQTAVPASGEHAEEKDEEARDDSFRFFYDFGPYWCNWISDAFHITERSVERLVEEVLIKRWAVTSRGRAEDDARHTHNLYPRSNYPYKSDWPVEEDLDFYLSVQALYEVAGRLLRQVPVQTRYSDDEETGANEYTRFLDVHMPSRSDGRWVADRRDAPPAHGRARSDVVRSGNTDEPDLEWTFKIDPQSFVSEVFRPDDRVVVSASREMAGYTRRESVRVSSALVTPATAQALLRALQTAPDKRAFGLPEANDRESGSDNENFELEGWIESQPERSGQDKHDPLAGDIAFPPDRPSQVITGITPSPDMRLWHDSRGAVAMESLVWSEWEEGRSSRGVSGGELLADRTWLASQLRRLQRYLVIEVEIHRRCDDSSTGFPAGDDDDENLGYLMPYTKYYLLDSDGGVHEQH